MRYFTSRLPVVIKPVTDFAIAPGTQKLSQEDYATYCTLVEALTEANALRVKAAADAARAVEEAKSRGLEEGRQLAQDELTQAVSDVRASLGEEIALVEPVLADVVEAAIVEILGEQNPLVVVENALRKSLKRLVGEKNIIVRVASEHARKINFSLDEVVEYRFDPELAPCDVIIETPTLHIDMRLDRRLAAIRRAAR